MPDVVPPVHDDAVEYDPLTEAIISLVRHDATCPDCAVLLPDAECEAREELKATEARIRRRREIREGARLVAAEGVRRSSPNYGSAGATTEEATR